MQAWFVLANQMSALEYIEYNFINAYLLEY